MSIVKLKESTVYRGGITSTYGLSKETSYVEFHPYKSHIGCPYFTFSIASKGGGVTKVRLEIPLKDWRAILEGLVANEPDMTALFLEIAATALEREQARRGVPHAVNE